MAEMAKPAKSESAAAWLELGAIRPYAVPVAVLGAGMLALLFLCFRVDRFLATHSGFALAQTNLGEAHSPNLRITGLARVPMHDIRRVFQADEGRSLYLLPIADRRDQLRRLLWVRDASVRRIWPDRVLVDITERTPVAYAQIPSGRNRATSLHMVDEEGVLLPPDRKSGALPVLIGLRSEQDPADRAARVRLMRKLFGELGQLSKRVPEVDLTNPRNLKVIYTMDGRAFTLVLGGDHWTERILRFVRHWDQIQERMPDANRLDLRLEDRITAVEEADGA